MFINGKGGSWRREAGIGICFLAEAFLGHRRRFWFLWDKMAIYVFFIVLWKYIHADVRRAATFYRWVFFAASVAFATFMWILDIKLLTEGW